MKIPEPKRCPAGWRIQLRLGGKSKYITADTAKECKRRAELYKAQFLSSGPVSASTVTMRQAIQHYLNQKSNILSPSTIRGYDSVSRCRFQDVADDPAADVDWQLAVNREAAVLNAKTVRNAWAVVSTSLKSVGIPVPEISLPTVVRNEHPWLTPDQIKIFIQSVYGKDIEVPALLCLHGLRCSEVYALDYDSVSSGMIHVRGAKVLDRNNEYVTKKTNKNATSRRDVPVMIPRLTEAIAERAAAGLPFLTYTTQTLSKGIDRICSRAGLPQCGAHGLRHSFCSAAYHAGLSERETMVLGGWSDPAVMRAIYTHISNDDLKQANKKMTAFFKTVT